MKDYLAWIEIGGGSSWCRMPKEEDAIYCAINRLKDWDRLFDVYEKPVTVHTIEVTGYADLIWDYEGVYGVPEGSEDEKYIKIDRPMAHHKRTTPAKFYAKKRKASGYKSNSLRDFTL